MPDQSINIPTEIWIEAQFQSTEIAKLRDCWRQVFCFWHFGVVAKDRQNGGTRCKSSFHLRPHIVSCFKEPGLAE